MQQSPNHSTTNVQVFKSKFSYVKNLIIPIAILIIFMGDSLVNGGISLSTVLFGLIIGSFVYFLARIRSYQGKIVIENDSMYYQKRSVDLSQLASLRMKDIPLLILTDKSGKYVRISLGDWESQDQLLIELQEYSVKAGGTIDDYTQSLIMKATQRRAWDA